MAKNSLDETRALKVLLAQVRGFCESIQDILHNKDTAEIGRYTSFRDMAHTYNDLAETARVLLRVPSMFYTFNVDEMPSWGDSVWPVQKKILVYDLGVIQNEEEFRRDIENAGNVKLIIVKH